MTNKRERSNNQPKGILYEQFAYYFTLTSYLNILDINKLGENCLFKYIRKAWFKSVKGLNAKNRPMVALDIDAPLWHLSKFGCTKRDKSPGNYPIYHRCEVKELCIKGRVKIKGSTVELET